MTSRSDKIAPDEQLHGEPEPFLARWSRRKDEARRDPQQPLPQKAADSEPAPQLPPLDKLTLESDYRGFLHPKVSEDMRRAALKKLFSDPHFNVMDGLDVYIDDYSKSEPIPAAMLASLKQAQRILEWAKEDEEKSAANDAASVAAAAVAELPVTDAAPRTERPSDAVDAVPASKDGRDAQTKS